MKNRSPPIGGTPRNRPGPHHQKVGPSPVVTLSNTGLHACDVILKSPHLNEDRAQYEELVDTLIDEFKPKGILQEHLVLKIANSLWRYRRLINAETAHINQQLEDTAGRIERGYYISILADPDDLDEETVARQNANRVSSKSMPSESHRETLQRYEMRLDRQLTRSFRLLHQLQDPNRSKPALNASAKNFFPGN